ncbi:putative sulfate transporter 3.4 [Bienertia sinuspersici]
MKCVILDMSAMTVIDTSGIKLLGELRKMMERSLQLLLANPTGNLMEKLHQSKALEPFGSQ